MDGNEDVHWMASECMEHGALSPSLRCGSGERSYLSLAISNLLISTRHQLLLTHFFYGLCAHHWRCLH